MKPLPAYTRIASVTDLNSAAQASFDSACAQLLRYGGDPMASALEAAALDPHWGMPHVLMAWLHLLGTEPHASAQAHKLLDVAHGLRLSCGEQSHWRAAHELASGHWFKASDSVLAINLASPLDALALQVGHQIDFFTGNPGRLLDRIKQAVPAWDADMRGFHGVLAMHAFGCEENGDYAQAEALGRRAAALEPRDGWAWHAVAHVMEMQRRPRDGEQWFAQSTQWHDDSFFRVHNHWHWALFHLANGRIDEVLARYDDQLAPADESLALNLLDASSMLWRLHLRAVDVDSRWEPLAKAWERHATISSYAFNDLHAMMAFAMTGRDAHAEALLSAQRAALADPSHDNQHFLSQIGHAACLSVRAFAKRDFAAVVALLEPVIEQAAAFGGSHAQRDVLTQTLAHARMPIHA